MTIKVLMRNGVFINAQHMGSAGLVESEVPYAFAPHVTIESLIEATGTFAEATKMSFTETGRTIVNFNKCELVEFEITPTEFSLHRPLTASEAMGFRLWARTDYIPHTPINSTWHPCVQAECAKINSMTADTPQPQERF